VNNALTVGAYNIGRSVDTALARKHPMYITSVTPQGTREVLFAGFSAKETERCPTMAANMWQAKGDDFVHGITFGW